MLRNLCGIRVTGTGFNVSGHGARKYSGEQNLFEKEYFTLKHPSVSPTTITYLGR